MLKIGLLIVYDILFALFSTQK